jgi:hypothetical protein
MVVINVSVTSYAVPFAAGATSSRTDRTAEMARIMLKECPDVSLTLDKDANRDYILLLRDKGHQSLLLRGDKSIIFASKWAEHMSKVTKQGCNAIMSDWHARNVQASRDPRWNTK